MGSKKEVRCKPPCTRKRGTGDEAKYILSTHAAIYGTSCIISLKPHSSAGDVIHPVLWIQGCGFSETTYILCKLLTIEMWQSQVENEHYSILSGLI